MMEDVIHRPIMSKQPSLPSAPNSTANQTSTSAPVRGRYSLQLIMPIPAKSSQVKSSTNLCADEVQDLGDSDKPPLLTALHQTEALNPQQPFHENDLFKQFHKQLAENDEITLKDLSYMKDQDLICEAMAEIKTRSCTGHSKEAEDALDSVSISDFQGIQPFKFHENLKSSRDLTKRYHIENGNGRWTE